MMKRRLALWIGGAAVALAVAPLGMAWASQAPATAPSPAPAIVPFDRTEADSVIGKLITEIDDRFVFPDIGKAYAAMLRQKLAAGAYANFPDAKSFATQVTADLQAVHKDGHLKLIAPKPGTDGQRQAAGDLGQASGVAKMGWLAPGVAYINLTLFPGNEATLADIRRFLADYADAKTVIIDARDHHGGGLDEMDLMFAQFFAKPTALVQMDTRVAVDEEFSKFLVGSKTVTRIPGPEGVVRREHRALPATNQSALRGSKIYLLTSKRTGSAGEHLSLALKRTHRATLIGEPTFGAGHYGDFTPLGFGYTSFIPVGRTFDPDTNQGWEGTGVAPDIAVSADRALDEALRLAGVAMSGKAALAALH